MAKSIYDIVDSGKAEITHNGADCIVTLPEWWIEIGEMALNANDDELLKNCTTLPIEKLRATMQAGIAKLLIELRAIARPADMTAKEGGKKRELIKPDGKGLLPQDRVDSYQLKPMKRPGKHVTEKSAEAQFAALTKEEKERVMAKMMAMM